MTLTEKATEILKELGDLMSTTDETESTLIQAKLDKMFQRKHENEIPCRINFNPNVKLRIFKKGENFAIFCERFKEYVQIYKNRR